MSLLWLVLTILPIFGGAARFDCRGRILGAYYADAKSGCKAFHVCVRVAGGGVRDFRFFCPPGTLFHQEAQTCTDWGDDDPLACPAEIYDGQFDLYKIGSGFDTKKSSSGNQVDDSDREFGLQRAETGDRRSSQNNVASNSGASDLRTAHSSDFFSGQRDRGHDDAAPQTPLAPSSTSRQSFRRPTTPRALPITSQTPQTQPPTKILQQEYNSKRKLVRKRPVYAATTLTPSTFAPTTPRKQFVEQPQQAQQQQNIDRRIPPQNRQIVQSTTSPANVPPQYKDEYVEVSRVTPKQNNKYFPSKNTSPTYFPTTTSPAYNKQKDNLIEVYNYESQSTPNINDNRPFKLRNSFSVSDVSINSIKNTPTTNDYNTASTRNFVSSTPSLRNFNSLSYESEKENFVSFPGSNKNYYSSPSTTSPTTTFYTTARSQPPSNLNTVAYNTNVGFNVPSSNFADNIDEDDGQYRPTAGEDDGQYRPELYEKGELLSGAHSLNIAASGNRLQNDQKFSGKSSGSQKQTTSQKNQAPQSEPSYRPASQTSAPRPFRPAPSPTLPSTQASRAPETYTTTTENVPLYNTQRTFDYFQTYTTTFRPSKSPVVKVTTTTENIPVKQSSVAPRTPEPRIQTRPPPPPPSVAPSARPTTKTPYFAIPANKKEDNSYDYAYYDSDTGFSEFDVKEEFGRTHKKV